jgi:hypothetical protein
MATRQDIEQGILDALAATLSDTLDISVDTAYDHVGLSERSDALEMPAYTFSMFGTVRDRGLSGAPLTASASAPQDNYEVVYANEHEATVDIAAHAPRDDSTQANALLTALERDMTLTASPSGEVADIHPDIQRGSLTVDGIRNVDTTSQALRAERLRVLFTYYTFVAVTHDLIDTIELDVTDLESGEQYAERTTRL